VVVDEARTNFPLSFPEEYVGEGHKKYGIEDTFLPHLNASVYNY